MACLWLALLFVGVASGRELVRQTEFGPGHPIVKRASEKCYDELGCFSTGGDFAERAFNVLPADRDKINTRFIQYSRENSGDNDGDFLKAGDRFLLAESTFNPNRPTKMISHGFLENGFVTWINDMRREYLINGDYNVIQIDWGGGSFLPYSLATANTRVVGAEIALLIDFLQAETGARPETFHVIGHSLGSHIGGYAGERLNRLGRITGMDPADPYFEDMPASVRLDETDAIYVDALHTDAAHWINAVIMNGGFGIEHPVGHADFYPNNGRDQPGCTGGPISDIIIDGVYEGIRQWVACNHIRAIDFMAESINARCPFKGYPCSSWEDFTAGRCLSCDGEEGCSYMGEYAIDSKPKNGKFNVEYFLVTGKEGPFCRYHYQVKLDIGQHPDAKKQGGWLYVEIFGTKGSISASFSSSSFDITPGVTYYLLATDPTDIGDIRQVDAWWECDDSIFNPFGWCWVRKTEIYIQSAEVVRGEADASYQFCGYNTPIDYKVRYTLGTGAC